jgi:hypothetical protein
METLAVIAGNSLARMIVPDVVKLMVFVPPAVFELMMAWRSDPGPLSLALLTMKSAATAWAEMSATIPQMSSGKPAMPVLWRQRTGVGPIFMHFINPPGFGLPLQQRSESCLSIPNRLPNKDTQSMRRYRPGVHYPDTAATAGGCRRDQVLGPERPSPRQWSDPSPMLAR